MRRKLPPRIASFVSSCCKRPIHARRWRRAVPAGNMIQRPRRDVRMLLPATTSRASIVMTVRKTAGGISIFYDVGQGQGWQRNIVMDGSPHLPANIRQWYGDSRGHWEGNTLVIDVTNFSPKTDFQGSREGLHLIERWTRTGPTTLGYEVTIEDPNAWTRRWTAKEEFTKQSDAENRLYYEPRCVEGNF